MPALNIPSRQVHLDFHTSEHIKDVGAAFEESHFKKAIKLAKLNSITVFAKCHHSWSYYPTKIGRSHPHLKTDLLGRMISAAHSIGVRCPIYYTVGWSANDAVTHPGWCVRKRDGSISALNVDPNAAADAPRPGVSWINLCPSGDYLALILDQTQEICQRYPTDGLFYDLCNMIPCFCDQCRAAMKAQQIDESDSAAVARFTEKKWLHFMSECTRVIKGVHPGASIFFNGLAQMSVSAEVLALQTHFELEDLPTVWGGYDKFPPRARYFSHLDKPMLAMSGKFHTMWGEFGGFKHPDALRFEAASMIAYGARCSFGDQLHPSGKMELATYRNIGHAYAHVEKIEAYGIDGKPAARLGVLPSKARAAHAEHGLSSDGDDQGTFNMLMESHLDFDIASLDTLDRFDTLILTGGAWLDASAADAIARRVRDGATLLILGESALDRSKTGLLFDVGATYLGPPQRAIDYTRVTSALIGEDLPDAPFLNYLPAGRYKPRKPMSALADIHEPYFDRTMAHFCSHLNTPNRVEPEAHSAAIRHGNVMLLPHRLGQLYYEHGARVHRQLFINALQLIHKKPTIEADLPSAGRVSLLHQPERRRYAAHLLYGPPLQRGRCLVIEDLPTLHDVAVRINVPEKICSYRLPLESNRRRPVAGGKRLSLRVDVVNGHQLIVLEY